MSLYAWCNRIIKLSFYLLVILVPIIFTPWNFELFEYNKMMLVYALTAIISAAWIVKMIDARKFEIARTPLDLPIALFVLSQLVSALFSIDPHVSWFGYYSRFNGGMWSIISYVLLYYAFVTNLDKYAVLRILKAAIISAVIVALYGVAEHFGIDKTLWVQDVQSRVFSSLGQPNWLAAYLVAVIPIAFALYFRQKFWGIAGVLFFIVLLYTRSRSGYLGLAVADVTFWAILYLTAKVKHTIRMPLVLAHLVLFAIVFFNGTYVTQIDSWFTLRGWQARLTKHQAPAPKPQVTPSGTALETGGTESGTIRKYVWQGAINAWRGSTKNMVIGTGTETFAFAFYKYRPAAHNLTSEWDFLYNKAHNEYLNYLATTGLFGLGSYIFILCAFIWWYGVHFKNLEPIEHALFAGWMSILVTNFFGFSVVIMQVLLFLLPAAAFITSGKSAAYEKPLRVPRWTGYIPAGSAILMLVLLGRFWKADTLYADGSRLGRSGAYAQGQQLDARAIALNPDEPTYHDDMASILSSLTLSAAQDKNASLAADLAKRAIAESDRAIGISPNNVNYWKTRTKLFYTLSSLDPTMNLTAIRSLEKAQTLSPNDPKIYYNLAILEGRDGKNDKAIELLKKAKEIKANYRDAYFGLYVFYSELKEPDLAKAELAQYLTNVDPTDKEFQDRLKQP